MTGEIVKLEDHIPAGLSWSAGDDMTVALNNALAACSTYTRSNLILPPGIGKMSGQWDWRGSPVQNIVVRGAGRQVTQLHCSLLTDSWILIGDHDFPATRDVTFQDMGFQQVGVPLAGAVFDFRNTKRIQLHNLTVRLPRSFAFIGDHTKQDSVYRMSVRGCFTEATTHATNWFEYRSASMIEMDDNLHNGSGFATDAVLHKFNNPTSGIDGLFIRDKEMSQWARYVDVSNVRGGSNVSFAGGIWDRAHSGLAVNLAPTNTMIDWTFSGMIWQGGLTTSPNGPNTTKWICTSNEHGGPIRGLNITDNAYKYYGGRVIQLTAGTKFATVKNNRFMDCGHNQNMSGVPLIRLAEGVVADVEGNISYRDNTSTFSVPASHVVWCDGAATAGRRVGWNHIDGSTSPVWGTP